MKIWFLVFLLLPVGCGTSSNGIKDWVLQLELPRAISGDSARQRDFLARVSKLEVSLQTASGEKKEYYATAGHFENIHLNGFEFKPESGTYRITARVWGTSDRGPIPVIVMEGSREITSNDIKQASDRTFKLVLHQR